MPAIVYASLDVLKAVQAVRDKERDFIDLSKVSSDQLAEQVETIRTHQTEPKTVFIGYIDPLYMLSPYHETILRRGLTDCRIVFVCSDPTALSFCWKNGITELHCIF